MLMPSIFGENLFDDDWMNFPFNDEFWGKKNPLYGKHAQNMMKTDIREKDNGYELDIDLPGFKKDEIKGFSERWLSDNQAAKGLDKDEKDKEGKYISVNVMQVHAQKLLCRRGSKGRRSKQNMKMVF